MKNWAYLLLALYLVSIMTGCSTTSSRDIYNGEIETTKIRLSSQLPSTIKQVLVAEGQQVVTGQVLVLLDTENIRLQLQQQTEKVKELDLNLDMIKSQISQTQAQLALNQDLLHKTEILVSEGAVIAQKKEELITQVTVLMSQLDGLKVNTNITQNKRAQLLTGIKLLEIQLGYGTIQALIPGIIINKFHSQGELVSPGTPLVEVADLRHMEAKIYVPLQELSKFSIGSKANIKVDGLPQPLIGQVSWVAAESEFTPKTILTKETRTTLVYAVKLDVPNEKGILKIGMPIEVELVH